MKAKKNSQLIHEELWKVVRAVSNKSLTPEEADSITNAVGKMIGLALLEIKSKELKMKNPIDEVDTAHVTKELKEK